MKRQALIGTCCPVLPNVAKSNGRVRKSAFPIQLRGIRFAKCEKPLRPERCKKQRSGKKNIFPSAPHSLREKGKTTSSAIQVQLAKRSYNQHKCNNAAETPQRQPRRCFGNCGVLLAVVILLVSCSEPSPAITGRLRGPSDLVAYRGCPEELPSCDVASEGHPLLLVSNSLEDCLRVFDVQTRRFFSAPDPLFPFSVAVGHHPHSMALDPEQRYAFVVNAVSQDVSLVDLAPGRLVEVDGDGDSCTSFCGSCREAGGEYRDERCRAGVSRVVLAAEGSFAEPDDIAVPAPLAGEDPAWDPARPLPVFVSLTGSGQVARLEFHYPNEQLNIPQRLELVGFYEVGGMPTGLALDAGSQHLFVGDADSDSITAIDLATGAMSRIEVGGASRRLALAPDGVTLYVVLPQAGEVALVDTTTLTRVPAGWASPDSRNPDGRGENISVGELPQDLVFVRGVSTVVYDESGAEARDYTSELLGQKELAEVQYQDPEYTEHVVETLAFVSRLDGSVTLLDAENHRAIDLQPFQGPSLSGWPVLVVAGEQVSESDLGACESTGQCQYPYLADISTSYEPPLDEGGLLDSCSGHGQAVLQGGQVVCRCDAGYHADGRLCLPEGQAELLRAYHGVWVRPGVTPSEVWQLVWEGVIEGSTGHGAHFEQWQLVDQAAGRDLAALGIEPGDILQVTSPPVAADGGADNPCRAGQGADEAETNKTEYTVTAVSSDRLELQPVAGIDLAACWGDTVDYRVRAHGAWTVWGSKSGAMPRLRMVSASELPLERPAYDNGVIALTMVAPQEGAALPRDSSWSFSISGGFIPARFEPSVLAGGAGAMVAIDLLDADQSGPGDDRIYMVYEASNAMLEFFPDNLDGGNYLFYQ